MSAAQSGLTVRSIAARLEAAGIERTAARREARLLISHFTGATEARLLTSPDEGFESEELSRAVEARERRYPLQYILGTWDFYGLSFKVNESTLIPRPDTEVIVEAAIAACPRGGRVLDLCTGTGCIAAAILANVADTRCVAVDLYEDTLDVARENMERLGLSERCELICGDATTELFPKGELFDVIVSNPPYITVGEMSELEPELSFEPEAALTDGGDGLSILSAMLGIYKSHLTETGVMLVEHGWRQSEAVLSIAASNGLSATPLRDYSGNPRGCRLRSPEVA